MTQQQEQAMPTTQQGTQVYLIRHAETVMNTKSHLVGGRSSETPLTPTGVSQAERLGRLLAERGILPARVFVSPALRTRETARICLEQMNIDIDFSVHDEIQELSQGIWEGKPRSEVYDEARLAEITRLGKDFKLEGGESMNEVALRMHNWMNETLPLGIEAPTPDRFFVFTHGGTIKYYLSHRLGWDHMQAFQTPIDNTSLTLLVANGENWDVEFYNRDVSEL